MIKRPWRVIDITGQRFHRLVVLGQAPQQEAGKIRWRCQCDCGKVVILPAGNMKNGHTKSCGCWLEERRPTFRRTHGWGSLRKATEKGRVYRVWSSAKQRCHNPTDDAYAYYGARGIVMCERWRESFEAFIEDMGPRPPGGTIDRRDNDGPYSPENCRWVTRRDQARNRRSSRPITWRGETRLMCEWSARLGIRVGTLSQRINGMGWSVERAFSTPVVTPVRRPRR